MNTPQVGVDGGVEAPDRIPLMTECKSMPVTSTRIAPLKLVWSRVRFTSVWSRLIPMLGLLVLGVTVPHFFLVLGLLLAAVALSILAFVMLVQVPVGYLMECWRGLQKARNSRRRRRRQVTR